ncbi:MAG TPA: carboxypeptidase-like regulatory domain-containing protein, partial [Herbaspirillum sp.]
MPPNAENPLKTRAEVSFYVEGDPLLKHMSSNIVLIDLLPVPALAFNGSTDVWIQPGQPFSIPLALRNSGNVPAIYKLTLRGDLGDSIVVVLDTDKDGGRDDGDIAFDMRQSHYLDYAGDDALLLTGTLPRDAAEGRRYQVEIAAKIVNADTNVIATAKLTLHVSSTPQIHVSLEASQRILGLLARTTVKANIANTGTHVLQKDKTIVIDDREEAVTLLRYRIPEGMRYVPGSAMLSDVGSSVLLFAASADPDFQYRTIPPESVSEIAIALRSALAHREGRGMHFELQLVDNTKSQIISQAEGFDGASLPAVASNILKFDTARNQTPDIMPRIVQRDADGGKVSSQIQIFVDNIGTSFAGNNTGKDTGNDIVLLGEVPVPLSANDISGIDWLCTVRHTAAGSKFQCINRKRLAVGGSTPPVLIDVSAESTDAKAGDDICDPDKKVTVTVSVPNEASEMTYNNTAAAPLLCARGAVVSGRAWIDAANDGIYRNGAEVLRGWHAQLLRGGIVVKEAITDQHGQYRIGGIMPMHGYSLRFLSPQGRIEAPPLDSRDADGALVVDAHRDFVGGTLIYDALMSQREYPDQDLALLPTGIIFNKLTGQPVVNAKVTLQGPQGFVPQLHLVGPGSNVTTITDAKGRYNFFLTPDAPAGLYRWKINAEGFEAPEDDSALNLKETARLSGPDEVRSAYKVFDATTIPKVANDEASNDELLHATARSNGYFSVTRVQGAKRVVNNHLGLAPLLAGGELSLQKTADRKTVE